MALLLAKYGPGHPELPRRYFREIAKMADTAWFVIREQNLRFDWVKDVDKNNVEVADKKKSRSKKFSLNPNELLRSTPDTWRSMKF